MIYSIFHSENGLGILLSGWESEFLRLVFTVEILAIVLGVIIGLLLPPLRVIKGILLVFIGISFVFIAFVLLLKLKCCIFGISSDAEIVYPYAGDILTASTGLHLLTMRLKKVR